MTEIAAMMAIAAPGPVRSATSPARAAPTPCMASVPDDWSPSACPASSSGVSAISRCWSMSDAEYPTEAAVQAMQARQKPGWVRNTVVPLPANSAHFTQGS